ncbi:STAS domain-containing protein [Streptomyces sp. TG1A-8]|uniref:STAS domain-containing protein n=1 Tax=Streptomyces sp. TG1A-8 TaxID=3051385 RepID=UPI00265C5C59|nr:STAS domain-containing protein [Streptomyces sp. TG1A-8]MDO0924334.1 STAS domain-containing protein [Streptomyces sp. TG1A-8]
MAEGRMTDSVRAEPNRQPDALSADSTVAEGVRVVTLAGEIDHHTGDALRRALDVPDGPPRVVADLHRVTFMDSSGINILLAAHRTLTEAGGWLRLAAPTPSVLRTLQIVGIDSVIDCRDTLHQALDG